MYPGGQDQGWQPQSYDHYGQQPGAGQQPAHGQPGYTQPPGYAPPAGYPQSPAQGQPPAGYPQPPAQGQPPAYGQPGYVPGYGPQPAYGQYPQTPPPPPPSNRSHILAITGVAVVLMLVVVGFAAVMVARSDDDGDDDGRKTADPGPSTSAPATNPPANPRDGLTVGSGPVKVDVYVDYQCPPCSTFEAATESALAEYLGSNRITLAIHPVAFVDSRSKNRYATRAAAAMACAHEGGKALEMHGHLLRNQPPEDTAGPTDEQLAATGETLGLGAGFRQCVISGARVTWVADATSAAKSAGVTSVPAAFVDGQKIDAKGDALTDAVG